jgi:hypothetical protein
MGNKKHKEEKSMSDGYPSTGVTPLSPMHKAAFFLVLTKEKTLSA